MKTLLKLTPDAYDDLVSHLLPPEDAREQAAFLFAVNEKASHIVTFNVLEITKLVGADFDEQASDFLELSDRARASLIKHAHDLGASLIEVHSHPGLFAAAFSYSDLLGLDETVPHMWWRLHKRPYIAMVLAPSGFDALVWLDDPRMPSDLDCLIVGDRMLRPTNMTLETLKRRG